MFTSLPGEIDSVLYPNLPENSCLLEQLIKKSETAIRNENILNIESPFVYV